MEIQELIASSVELLTAEIVYIFYVSKIYDKKIAKVKDIKLHFKSETLN